MASTVATVDPIGQSRQQQLTWLLAAAAATVVLWQLPFGPLLLYPFTLLATWFHEMAHGLAAELLGGRFVALEIHASASGLAHFQGPLFGGQLGEAAVAAAGPLGPSLAGAALILASRRAATTRAGLLLLAVAMLGSALLWVRTPVGLALVIGLGLVIGWVAVKADAPWQAFAIQFLGVQACISTFQQVGYLFMPGAQIGGQYMLSDTGHMARVLLLPHWFWGGLLTVVTLGLLAGSLWWAMRPRR